MLQKKGRHIISWTANVDFVQFANLVDFHILPMSHLSGCHVLCGFRFLGSEFRILPVDFDI